MIGWWLLPSCVAVGYIIAKAEESVRRRRSEQAATEAYRARRDRLWEQYGEALAREQRERSCD